MNLVAENYKLGDKFKHINGTIFVIVEEEGKKYFKSDNLDLYTIVHAEWYKKVEEV